MKPMRRPIQRLALLCLVLATQGIGIAQTMPALPNQENSVSQDFSRLPTGQRQALAPLAAQWSSLTPIQRGKWQAIAHHFDQLSATEQQILQARMKEWVALGPVQRNQARLNFNHLQNLSKDEKKSRWDEYQALTEEERRKLSAGALTPSRTAAPSPKPTGSERLVQPNLRTLPPAALPPRTPVDQKTLLPKPPSEPAVTAPDTPGDLPGSPS